MKRLKQNQLTRCHMSVLLLLLSLSRPAFAEHSESTLAERVETQAEVAVGHTNFTAAPMSRFAILVAEAAQGNMPPQLREGNADPGGGPPLEFQGDRPAAITLGQFIATAPTSTLIPLQSLQTSPMISELAGRAGDSIQLLNLALDKAGGIPNPFLTMSAKGAIQSWNSLVNTLMDRMEALYKDPVPDVREWESIRNFLMDPKTIEYRGVLANFVEKKSAK